MIVQYPAINAISSTMHSVEDSPTIATYALSTLPSFLVHIKTTLQTVAGAYLAILYFPNTPIHLKIEELLDFITANPTKHLYSIMNIEKKQMPLKNHKKI